MTQHWKTSLYCCTIMNKLSYSYRGENKHDSIASESIM